MLSLTYSHSYARNCQQSRDAAALPTSAPIQSEAKRTHIIEAATQHFAEHGYHAARVGDIAIELNIAKGSILRTSAAKTACSSRCTSAQFVHSRNISTRLRTSVRRVSSRCCVTGWCGPNTWSRGLDSLSHLIAEIMVRTVLKREINRFLISEDPYGGDCVSDWIATICART